MSAADLPAVGRLFMKIFRSTDSEASSDLVGYLDAVAFGSPSYNPAVGSFVFAESDGAISSAVLAIPMRFVVCGRTVAGRLMCAFMTQSTHTAAGAGTLGLTLRAKQQDFAYTDTVATPAVRHWRAFGGQAVTLQHLCWVRRFRPIADAVDGLSRRVLRGRGRALAVLAAPFDRVLRSRFRAVVARPAPGLSVAPMSDESFFDHAPGFVARYAVRPEWSRDELVWLLHMARQNRTLGRLAIDAVVDSTGRRLGCFVYYAQGLRTAHVLNVLALDGRETDVLAAMFSSFDRRGFFEARGRAQPALMEGLALQSLVSFRHEAFVCVSIRHADVVDAVRRGDVYLGGLAGEGWSRLMTDFY